MEPAQRPQRQRRAPSRFREAEETPASPKKKAGPALPTKSRSRPAGRPLQSRKRQAGAVPAPPGQGALSVLPVLSSAPPGDGMMIPTADAARLALPPAQAASKPGNTSIPDAKHADGHSPLAAGQPAPPSTSRAAPIQGSPEDFDVIIVEAEPRAMTPQVTTPATSSGRVDHTTLKRVPSLGPSVPPASRPSPPPPASIPQTWQPDSPKAPTQSSTRVVPLGSEGAPAIPAPAAAQSPAESAQGDRCAVSDEQPATTGTVPSSSTARAQGSASALFVPLFQREATPPRPDFSAGEDASSDSDIDLLKPRGRKRKKDAAHAARQRASLESPGSPVGSSPDKSVTDSPVQRARRAADTSWLKMPSPDKGRGGDAYVGQESATLLRLRKHHLEMLAVARAGHLVPDRILAESAAEARLKQQEREREDAQKEAQARARADAVVAAALRATQPEVDSQDDDDDEVREPEGVGQSVLLKIRASDGSQERFKIRCADPLEKLFRAYQKKVHPAGVPAGATFSFLFDGDPLSGKQTPQDLGLEDDDMIEVVRTK